MTFTLMITLNIVLDVALVGGLAFAMSRASLLQPHKPGVTGNRWRIRRPVHHQVHAYARGERAPLRQLDAAIEQG
jgi:hypothetical protein